MDGVDVGHPITFAALKDLLQHKPAAAGGKGDDSKPVKSTGGKVSYAAGHAALQRCEELLRSPAALAGVEQEPQPAQQEPEQQQPEQEPPSTEAQQLAELQEQVARLQQELAAKEVELAAASGSGGKGTGKRQRQREPQKQQQKQREPQKRKRQRMAAAADEVGEQPEGVFDGFVDHDGPMDTKHLLVGNSVVVYTTAQDANALRLLPKIKARVWIIQLDRLPVRMNEAGDIKLVGRFYTNAARKAWEPLRLSEQLDWCVVGPEAVLEVFEGEVDVVTPEQAATLL